MDTQDSRYSVKFHASSEWVFDLDHLATRILQLDGTIHSQQGRDIVALFRTAESAMSCSLEVMRSGQVETFRVTRLASLI